MKISIIVPVYNVENYIVRCARSLFEQTYNNIEFVFVDDCTQDNSITLLNNLTEEYPQREQSVKIIHHKSNYGLSAARNTAITHCTGCYLMHVDSDDYLAKDAVEKLVLKQQETEADIVTGQAIKILRDKSFVMERPQFENHDDIVKDMIVPSIHHTIWGRLIRKSLYTDNNIQAKEGVNIGEDMQVMCQLAYYAKKTVSVWDVIYYYDCTNESSYMNQYGFNSDYRLQQDTASMEVVRDFFVGKNNEFQDLAEFYLNIYYWKLLNSKEKTLSSEDFSNIKRRLFALSPENRVMSIRQRIKMSNYLAYLLTNKL